jgi:HTH-type transcriptional regulator, sugar sensing transcriptional regulator
MVDNNIIGNLLNLGLSEYEAKSYLALLKEFPVTSYEIAKKSGVPTSKIYEVLNRLLDKGLITQLEDNNKLKFVPISPEEFIESYKNKMDDTLNVLKNDLKSVKTGSDYSYIWNINRYENLLDKAKRLIQNAKKSLMLSLFSNELDVLFPYLIKAEKNKIKIAVIHFGKTDHKVGQLFRHPIEDTIYSEKGGRNLVVVRDSEEVLAGTIYPDELVQGAMSQNNGFVTMSEDYIKHDIYIMKIVERFDNLLIKKFGDNYKKLRDIFSDNEE